MVQVPQICADQGAFKIKRANLSVWIVHLEPLLQQRMPPFVPSVIPVTMLSPVRLFAPPVHLEGIKIQRVRRSVCNVRWVHSYRYQEEVPAPSAQREPTLQTLVHCIARLVHLESIKINQVRLVVWIVCLEKLQHFQELLFAIYALVVVMRNLDQLPVHLVHRGRIKDQMEPQFVNPALSVLRCR
jgi:hypothetical protein